MQKLISTLVIIFFTINKANAYNYYSNRNIDIHDSAFQAKEVNYIKNNNFAFYLGGSFGFMYQYPTITNIGAIEKLTSHDIGYNAHLKAGLGYKRFEIEYDLLIMKHTSSTQTDVSTLSDYTYQSMSFLNMHHNIRIKGYFYKSDFMKANLNAGIYFADIAYKFLYAADANGSSGGINAVNIQNGNQSFKHMIYGPQIGLSGIFNIAKKHETELDVRYVLPMWSNSNANGIYFKNGNLESYIIRADLENRFSLHRNLMLTFGVKYQIEDLKFITANSANARIVNQTVMFNLGLRLKY